MKKLLRKYWDSDIVFPTRLSDRNLRSISAPNGARLSPLFVRFISTAVREYFQNHFHPFLRQWTIPDDDLKRLLESQSGVSAALVFLRLSGIPFVISSVCGVLRFLADNHKSPEIRNQAERIPSNPDIFLRDLRIITRQGDARRTRTRRVDTDRTRTRRVNTDRTHTRQVDRETPPLTTLASRLKQQRQQGPLLQEPFEEDSEIGEPLPAARASAASINQQERCRIGQRHPLLDSWQYDGVTLIKHKDIRLLDLDGEFLSSELTIYECSMGCGPQTGSKSTLRELQDDGAVFPVDFWHVPDQSSATHQVTYRHLCHCRVKYKQPVIPNFSLGPDVRISQYLVLT